jgi:endonuclease YncB( thermonuclease family)
VTARDQLVKYSAGRPWECDLTGTDIYGRSLGKCFVEGDDISAWMWCGRVGPSRSSGIRTITIAKELAAQEAKAGLWAGAFIAPWDWRHRNRATVVLGALKVPIDAQKT